MAKSKFFVVAFVDVTKSEYVEAESAEAALEKAQNEFHASLCHQCGGELNCGEFFDWEVLDEAQENVLIAREDDAEGTDIADAPTEELEEAIADMRSTLDMALAELARRKPKPVIAGRQKKGQPS